MMMAETNSMNSSFNCESPIKGRNWSIRRSSEKGVDRGPVGLDQLAQALGNGAERSFLS
jgi:hypothetical protein